MHFALPYLLKGGKALQSFAFYSMDAQTNRKPYLFPGVRGPHTGFFWVAQKGPPRKGHPQGPPTRDSFLLASTSTNQRFTSRRYGCTYVQIAKRFVSTCKVAIQSGPLCLLALALVSTFSKCLFCSYKPFKVCIAPLKTSTCITRAPSG